jgi:hypothetical protein
MQETIKGHVKKAMEAHEAGKQTELNLLIQKAKEEWFYDKFLDPDIKAQLDRAQKDIDKTNRGIENMQLQLEAVETKPKQAAQKRLKQYTDNIAKNQARLLELRRACTEARQKQIAWANKNTRVGNNRETVQGVLHSVEQDMAQQLAKRRKL